MGVSIIIPYHRGEHFLRDCLDSIVEARLEEYEVIIVRDVNRLNNVDEEKSILQ
nr:hypothetical protein [Lachnospiraceae bacterium]